MVCLLILGESSRSHFCGSLAVHTEPLGMHTYHLPPRFSRACGEHRSLSLGVPVCQVCTQPWPPEAAGKVCAALQPVAQSI